MQTKEFLESNGYRVWKEENDQYSNTLHFQKRVDTIYEDSPLCQLNDKLLINIQVWNTWYHDTTNTSCSIDLCHERPDDEWCDLKIYSLTVDQLKSNLKAYEDKVIKLWELFYE